LSGEEEDEGGVLLVKKNEKKGKFVNGIHL